MRIPPLLARTGCEQPVCRAIAGAMRGLARASRADLVTLYRMDRQASAPLVEALGRQGVYVKQTLFTPAQQLRLDDDVDACLRARPRASHAGTCAGSGGASSATPAPNCASNASRPAPWTDGEFRSCLERLEAVQRATWQHDWETQADTVDSERTRRFNRQALDLWRRRGWLAFHFLVLGDKTIAHTVNLDSGGRIWGLVTGYDQAYKRYGVGKMAFVEALRDWHAHGRRLFELGGEVLGWKRDWGHGRGACAADRLSAGRLEGPPVVAGPTREEGPWAKAALGRAARREPAGGVTETT